MCIIYTVLYRLKSKRGLILKKVTVLFLFSIFLSGCATNPDEINASYVSALKYSSYDCQQLGMELDYVGQRTNRLYNQLKAEQKGDQWQMGVGMLLFWPALLALEGGDGPNAAEYAQLKGEYEALRQNVVQKRCGFETKSPQEMIESAAEADKKS